MTVPTVAVGNADPLHARPRGDSVHHDPLSPIRESLRAIFARPDGPPYPGITAGLTIDASPAWRPATELVSGLAMDEFLDTAKQRWRATPHAAAALAWKCYSYWLSLPAVLGYAAARRVPLVRPEAVRWQWSVNRPFLVLGLTDVEVAVLPSDPLAVNAIDGRGAGGVRVVADEQALLAELRTALLDEHLTPLLDQVRRDVHVAARTFWGSLASGVAHGVSRAAEVVPGSTLETADEVLSALGVRDLVELGPREGGRPGVQVQRRTCCLAFTLPEPKVCSGCCIRKPGDR